ncbi:hypothetical protein R5R35_013739 [Gryllus longicercus]|uniref:ubiquitinyl hydrolase 1 n=2 Tax=Gryllus longicercus TaxID=2509291 RepID=A0AAN9VRH2_9ORTH
MASSIQEIAFLDLTDIDEVERDHLQQVLCTITPNLQLPWEVQNEEHCSSEFEPTPFAVAPIPHPTLRGVFLPQPLYTTAPAAVAVGLVPSTAAEPPNGPAVGLVSPIDSLECNPGPIVASTTPPAGNQVQASGGVAGETGYPSENAPVQMLSVPPPASSVPPSTQPVMTSMYQVMGHTGMPLSNVYVGNVTANVNVHSFVGPPLTPYSPHISQQVYPTGEVAVPHETSGSPNATRNGLGQRRPRNSKPGSKRMEGQFGPRTPGVGHGHEVLPAMVESPTGPPFAQMVMVPPMHPAFHNPHFYQSPTQPHGTPHMPQHPSAQHATGAPFIVPLIHPVYNAFPPPAVYPASPNMVPTPVATTEHSSGITYQVNEGPTERMMPEGRETEVTVHEQQNLYENETPQLKNSINGEEKMSSYVHQDSDTESCTLASTVVVNNSNMATSTVVNEEYNKEISNSTELPLKMDKDVGNELVSGNCSGPDKTLPIECNTDVDILKVIPNVTKSPDVEIMTSVVEKQENSASAFPVPPKISPAEKPLCDLKPNGISSVPKQASEIPNATPKATSNSSPFTRPTVAENTTVQTPVASNREKTWASLFDKSSGSGLPSDGAMIIATGIAPGTAASKPLAAVRPFQNAVTVSGAGDMTRKTSDAASVTGDASKHFPQLGQSDLPAPSMANDPHLYRLGEFLSKYQLDHKAISLQPRGLTNRSNWCYINSTLQALLACPPFYNLMKSLSMPLRRSGKSSTPIIDSMVEFVNEFSPLSPVSRVNRKEKAQRKDDTIEVQVGAAFEPNYIYKMLSNIQSDTFKVEGRQEDAEEFFSCLLNALNDEMLELIKLVKDTSDSNISNGDVSNGDGANQSYEDDDDTEWKVMGKKNKGSVTRRAEFERTPVSDIFRGQLRSRVQRAGDYSDNVQPFFTLQLDIEKAQSVKEALDLLVGRDQLEGVTCSRTNQEVEAWQQVTLEELPLVLVLHLKWFNYKLDGCSKIVKTVEFPVDLKFEGKLMSSSNKYNLKQKQYKLFAVVYHDGKEATKGHYITDVYHVGYGGWVRYDDSSVKAIQETHMLHPRGSRVPYLLYYRRCDTIGSAAATPDKSR